MYEKKFYFFLFSISLLVQTVCAQDAKQVVKLIESQRDAYYYGHGYAVEYDDAVNKAKAQLVSDISTFVSSSMYGTISNDGVTMEERVSTYSNMVQLREVTTIVVAESPTFHVFCYITKEIVNNMFEERKAKMNNYFNEGVKAEGKLHITDALQNYYWALLILRTLPDDQNITFTDDKGEKQNMLLWLNKHIREVVDNVNFKIGGVSGSDTWRVLDVLVSYHDKPVVNCDYKYWTGMGYSQVVRAKNGHGVAEFQQVPEKVTFYVEYSFENEAKNVDPELRDIMQKSEKPSFKNSQIVSTGDAVKSAATAAGGTKHSQGTKETLTESSQDAFKGTAKDNASVFFSKPSAGRADSCTTIMNAVKNAVRTKDYSSIQHLFTQEGWKLFHQMFTTGKTTIVRDDQPVFLQTPKKIICRSLHMSFFYPRSSKTIVEDVEFELNLPDLKISSVAFTLNSEAESDIMDNNKKWSDVSRYQLIHFLQNYQTAYATKRTDYLDEIFSEDALIIVGTKVKKAPSTSENSRIMCDERYKEQYVLTTVSKAKFIEGLARVFANNEFVNLQFKDNEIRRAGNGEEIYGIQIKQLYASSSYADQGYLFLVVDLRNPDKPIIHVRTWQPDKDPNFGLFDLGMFKF